MGQFWPPRPARVLAGQASGVKSTAWTTVTFSPVGFFTAVPRVVCTINGGAVSPVDATIKIKLVTASEFQVAVGSGSGVLVDWIAIQS